MTLLALSALASGCSERPADIPAPDLPFFARLGEDCPDLRGSYRIGRTDGRQLLLPGNVLRNAVRPPPFHGTLSIESLDESAMIWRSWASADDLRRGMQRWREDNDYGYALWSRSLVARPNAAGYVLERRPGTDGTPARDGLPRYREFRIDGRHFECKDGWVVFEGESEPDADSIGSAEVRMTRAADGGLVASWRFTIQQSLSLWCGDGCKPDIPLPDAHKENWWHLPPAPAIPDTPIDWDALIADDPRPAALRDLYVEGTQLHMRGARDAVTASSSDTRARDPVAAAPDAAAPAPATAQAPPGAESLWRAHLTPLLADGLSVDSVRCEADACTLVGHTRTMAAVSNLLRALTTPARDYPELVLIERDGELSHRFEVRLPSQP